MEEKELEKKQRQEDRIEKALSLPFSWAWGELQTKIKDPAPKDLKYVAERVVRHSPAHRNYKKIVDAQMDADGCARGIYYPTLLKLLAIAIAAFPDDEEGL